MLQPGNSWEVISDTDMSVARYECFAVALPAINELMVVGGSSGMLKIDSVEFASLLRLLNNHNNMD